MKNIPCQKKCPSVDIYTLLLCAAAMFCVVPDAVRAESIYVTNFGSNAIGEYTTSGSVVHSSLISGLNGPIALTLAGNELFVSNYNHGTDGGGAIGKYTILGATVKSSLGEGLSNPNGIAAS